MQFDDLDQVAACEQAAARFPWARKHFEDALVAGNSGWTLRAGADLLAQCVYMQVLDEAQILILSVNPAWQGQGLGRRLLRQVMERAQSAGAREFFLEVRPSNARALALYTSEGFEIVGRRKGYYPADDGQREDAIVMRCAPCR